MPSGPQAQSPSRPSPDLVLGRRLHRREKVASRKVDDISRHESRHDAKHLPDPAKQKAEEGAKPPAKPQPAGPPAPGPAPT
jgi:hypothetical protein